MTLEKDVITFEVCVGVFVEPGPRAEVDEFGAIGLDVYEDVLVFDVPVDDSGLVALLDGPDDLAEDVSRQPLVQPLPVGDEVEEVLAALGRGPHALHDQQVVVGQLEVVDQLDHAGAVADLPHQRHFQGDLDMLGAAADS